MAKRISSHVVLLAVLFFVFFTTPAHAYLDAGTGSFIIQLVIGGIAGVLVAGKLFWHQILSVFGLRKSADKDDDKKSS